MIDDGVNGKGSVTYSSEDLFVPIGNENMHDSFVIFRIDSTEIRKYRNFYDQN